MRLIIVDFGNEFVESENLDINIKFMKKCMDNGDAFLLDAFMSKEEAERLIRENDIPYSLLSIYGGSVVYNSNGKIDSYSEIEGPTLSSLCSLASRNNGITAEHITVDLGDYSEPRECGIILTTGANGFTKKVRVCLDKIIRQDNSAFTFTRFNVGEGVNKKKNILARANKDLSGYSPNTLGKGRSKVKVIDIRNWPNNNVLLERRVKFVESSNNE